MDSLLLKLNKKTPPNVPSKPSGAAPFSLLKSFQQKPLSSVVSTSAAGANTTSANSSKSTAAITTSTTSSASAAIKNTEDDDDFFAYVTKADRAKERPKSIEAIKAELINKSIVADRTARLERAGFDAEAIAKILKPSPADALVVTSATSTASSTTAADRSRHAHHGIAGGTLASSSSLSSVTTTTVCTILRHSNAEDECAAAAAARNDKANIKSNGARSAEDDEEGNLTTVDHHHNDDDDDGAGVAGAGGAEGGALHFGGEEFVDADEYGADEEGGYRGDRKRARHEQDAGKKGLSADGATVGSDRNGKPSSASSVGGGSGGHKVPSIIEAHSKVPRPQDVARFNRNIQRFALKEIHPRTRTELRSAYKTTGPPPRR